jgi:hypothetical protein
MLEHPVNSQSTSHFIATMPPRKSDASKVATGDEGTPVKDQPPREGINVEVRPDYLLLRLKYN